MGRLFSGLRVAAGVFGRAGPRSEAPARQTPPPEAPEPPDGWRGRLIGNGLLRTLSEKLVWRFVDADGRAVVARPEAGRLLDVGGNPIPGPGADARVELWHPMQSDAETVAGWRRHLAERRIRQPFIQAWRPIYGVTDAERDTATYSNRFAGHVLEQAPAMGILKKRGWAAFNRIVAGNSAEHERVRLVLPRHGVAAEFWVAGIGTRIQDIEAAQRGAELYAFINTDRVVFFPLDQATGKPGDAALAIDQVPAMAFTEVMYDIDHVIGRTSVGADRHWQDRGPDARHPLSERPAFATYRLLYAAGQSDGLAAARREFIASLLPGLAIADQCQVSEHYLMVDGRLNTYKISFGSGNVLVAPNDHYLCVVPNQSPRERPAAYVPFEGDDILSIILSKAFMLAEDDKVADPHIRHQIERYRNA